MVQRSSTLPDISKSFLQLLKDFSKANVDPYLYRGQKKKTLKGQGFDKKGVLKSTEVQVLEHSANKDFIILVLSLRN